MPAGILAALIFPAFAFAAEYLLRNNSLIINKPAIPYLAAIMLNLILIRVCVTKNLDKTSRGIMLATFAFMLLLFKIKMHF